MDKYGTYLFQAVYSVLRSVKDSEDVTQEVLLKIYASLPQYQHQGFKTWITRIAVNKAIDYKRSLDRKKEQLTDEWENIEPRSCGGQPVEDVVLQSLKKERVHEYLDELPEHYKEVLVAFYIEEKSYQQIAEERGMPLKTVESKLYRAKQYMRKHWKGEDWT